MMMHQNNCARSEEVTCCQMCQCMTFILISNFSGWFIYLFGFLPQTAARSRDCVLHIQHIPGTLTFHLQGCSLGWGLTRRHRGETARSGTGGGWRGEGEDGGRRVRQQTGGDGAGDINGKTGREWEEDEEG